MAVRQTSNPSYDMTASLLDACPDLADDDHIARLAVSEDGHVLYANEAFYALAGQKTKKIDAKSNILAEGDQSLSLKGQKDPQAFYFDALTLGQDQKILIGSQMVGGEGASLAGASLNLTQDFENFLEMSHDLMVVMDGNGKILRTNQSFLDVFGRVDSISLQEKYRDKNGFDRRIEWRTKAAGDLIYAVGEDVSAAKLHEEELSRRVAQLREAESIGKMGHWRWKIGQDQIGWSEQIFEMFGLDQSGFTPTIDDVMAKINRRDVGRVIQVFQRAMIEGRDYGMEFRINRPDGDVCYLHCEGRCERDDDGDVIALYGIMRDMTERMLHEQNLHDAKNAAERAYNAKSQFLANMSHELRTPLNAIIGFSEMMQRQLLGPIGTEKYLDYINGIRESGEHLLDLISDILDMSKIEAGKYDLDVEEMNPVKSIKLAMHMMEGRALESDVKIVGELPEEAGCILIADRRAFLQIMLNLMSNAVKFSHDKGQVTIGYGENENGVSIRVVDQGIGIPANKLNSILRPFEQVSVSYSRDHDGSGLGLAITKELVELHGGSLSIESRLGEGTSVTFTLPFEPVSQN